MRAIYKLKTFSRLTFWTLVLILIVSNSGMPATKFSEIVRVETRWLEFDYVSWTIKALFQKTSQATLGTSHYLSNDQQLIILQDYFFTLTQQRLIKDSILNLYTDPDIEDPQLKAIPYLDLQREYQWKLEHISFFLEGTLQQQLSKIIAENDLGFLYQPIPPLQYHVTGLPNALIVSPRDVIRQDADISLLPEMTLEEIDQLERTVEKKLNVSALVVPIGGVGVYPTMVMESTNLDWLAETIAHEWIHNYLTLKPLGMLYGHSPELRTMNETTASIAGKELGWSLIAEFYPFLLPKPVSETEEISPPAPEAEQEDGFNFRSEMHETRINVDEMLAKGEIEQAEQYMEQRRLLFVENGFSIRRLNQAYFAFHGAYADQPRGAAGADPVGEAVRTFRAQSESLSKFVRRIAWVTSFDGLTRLITTK